MISYDDALQLVIKSVSPLPVVEKPLPESSGLILASPATANWDMPRFNNSAMDGFALRAPLSDMKSGLLIIGSSYAGRPFARELGQGEAVRITTGANIPVGANTVIPIEDTEEIDGRIYFNDMPIKDQHIRYRGEEYKTGETIVEAGTKLRAGEIALLASAGVEKVNVYPRLRVAVISTGDELVELGRTPKPGQIVNSNHHFLKTRLCECGCIPVCIGIGSDDIQSLGGLIEQALDADMIISTGGVSIGEKDHVLATVEHYSFEKIFWKVAIKPGKPVLYGKLCNKPFFGLPGNPAAAAATFELFVKPAIKRLSGSDTKQPETRLATLTHDIAGGGKRQSFLWCSLEWVENKYYVTVSQRQGSGQSRCLISKNALLSVPTTIKSFKQGDQVEVLVIEGAS